MNWGNEIGSKVMLMRRQECTLAKAPSVVMCFTRVIYTIEKGGPVHAVKIFVYPFDGGKRPIISAGYVVCGRCSERSYCGGGMIRRL